VFTEEKPNKVVREISSLNTHIDDGMSTVGRSKHPKISKNQQGKPVTLLSGPAYKLSSVIGPINLTEKNS
jgi:hypothetical protein